MSIATLKKKTQAKYNNSSVGQKAFSLNGTHRSQGYVGQTSISRSLPRTLMNGPTPRGYGSCCGNYYTDQIIQSAVTSLNDPNVVKGSVVSTKGMLEEKLQCMSNIQETYFISNGPLSPYNVVKPDTNKNLNRQSDYVISLAKKAIKNADFYYFIPLNFFQSVNRLLESFNSFVSNVTLVGFPTAWLCF
jgi:hypothetical protein